MKKDRNCGGNQVPYPVYQMPPMMPNMIAPMPGVNMNPNMGYMPNVSSSNNSSIEQNLNTLNNQIRALENRISNLENLIGGNQNYNNSNYQMM